MESIEVNNMGTSTYKVPGGKLLKIKLIQKNGKIEKLTIMGDFFLHPGMVLSKIEKALVGTEIESHALSDVIQHCLSSNSANLIGASPEDIAKAIEMAKE